MPVDGEGSCLKPRHGPGQVTRGAVPTVHLTKRHFYLALAGTGECLENQEEDLVSLLVSEEKQREK